MKTFTLTTETDAPLASREALTELKDSLGFLPKVFAAVAQSPQALRAFMILNEQFSKTPFNITEREVIQLTASVENACGYCVAGHSAFAHAQHVPVQVINAIRESRAIDDGKLQALSELTREIIRKRGAIEQNTLDNFHTAGYTSAQALEVVLGVCVKMFSNLSASITRIPLDDEFADFHWHAITSDAA